MPVPILVWLCISLCLSDHFINHPLLSHIHILCSFWTMKWNAYIFTNACYQCKWEEEAYYQSRPLRSPHLCTLTGNKHLFVSGPQDRWGSSCNEKWRSCSNFALMDGTSQAHAGTMPWPWFGAGFYSQNWKWSLCLRSFVTLEVSKPSGHREWIFIFFHNSTKFNSLCYGDCRWFLSGQLLGGTDVKIARS